MIGFLAKGSLVSSSLVARNAAAARYDQLMRFGWKVLLPLNLVGSRARGIKGAPGQQRNAVDGAH